MRPAVGVRGGTGSAHAPTQLTTATTLAFSASSMHLAFFLAMFAQPMIPHLQTGLSILWVDARWLPGPRSCGLPAPGSRLLSTSRYELYWYLVSTRGAQKDKYNSPWSVVLYE